MIFGAVLAGGTGMRMQTGNLPKQFLPLSNKPTIIHTLEKFLSCPRFDGVYVGAHADWLDYTKDLIGKYLPDAQSRICVTAGGNDRNETIQNVIAAIEADHGFREEDVIVTHDAVRPFVTRQMIEENIDGALRYGAVDTVVAAVDTIVVSEDGAVISDIPDRRKMYQGQTPQSFRIGVLKDLYRSLTSEEKQILTDACKICVVRNYPVYLVNGSYTNLKLTTSGDYQIAQAMVGDTVH